MAIGLLWAAVGCQPMTVTTAPPKPPAPKPVAQPPRPQAPTNPIVEVASHGAHSCVRRESGEVLCWGKNTYGQLGNGKRDASDSMTPVTGLSDATALVTGRDFSCALRKAGSVVCWGNNQDGQLGDGRGAKVGAMGLRPVKVAKLGRVRQLSSGDYHACALGTDGSVSCWGNGENGQIGRDDKRAFSTAVRIEQLGKASQIASGANHVCALQDDGRIKCWGRNTEGQLGDGKSGSKIKPVFVSGIAGATALWSGHTFTCAEVEGGAVRCWGDNKKGQLGPEGGRDPKWNAPIRLVGVSNAVELVGGEAHACARLSTGRVLCWGSNENGRAAGRGSGVVAKPTPVRGVSDAIALSAGAGHTCAVGKSGKVSCWGSTNDSALGRYRLASAADFGYDASHADSIAAVDVGPGRL